MRDLDPRLTGRHHRCRLRVARHDRGAAIAQHAGQRQRWRVADVIGAGLEGQSQEGNAGPVEAARDGAVEARGGANRLFGIHRVDGAGERHRHVVGRAHGDHRADVLRQAGAAVTDAGVEVLRADARIGGHCLEHRVDRRAGRLAQRGELVHEADARRQVRVRGVLHELGALGVEHEDRRTEWPVERLERLDVVVARRFGAPEHDAARVQEVIERAPGPQELGVGEDADRRGAAPFAQPLVQHGLDPSRRAHRHGAAQRHDGPPGEVLGEAVDDALDGAQVRLTGRARRGAHADEDDIGLCERVRRIGREAQAAVPALERAQLPLQVRLVVRRLPALQRGDLVDVGLEPGDALSEAGQAGGGHETDIAQADHRDLQRSLPLRRRRAPSIEGGDGRLHGRPIELGDDSGRVSSPLAPRR